MKTYPEFMEDVRNIIEKYGEKAAEKYREEHKDELDQARTKYRKELEKEENKKNLNLQKTDYSHKEHSYEDKLDRILQNQDLILRKLNNIESELSTTSSKVNDIYWSKGN